MENFSPECLNQEAGPPDMVVGACMHTSMKAVGWIFRQVFGNPGQDKVPAHKNFVVHL